jgi:hypothetical protein
MEEKLLSGTEAME